MKKGDVVFVVAPNGTSIAEGTFTGRVARFLSMVKVEVNIDGRERLVAVEFVVPVTDETQRLVDARRLFEAEASYAAQKAQGALEKLWFARVDPTKLVDA